VKKKVWLIVVVLLLFVMTLAVSNFFYRRNNSLRLLLEECNLDPTADSLQTIYDGEDTKVYLTRVKPNLYYADFEPYGTFLHLTKNEQGFWSIKDYSYTVSWCYSQYEWQVPLGNGQTVYHEAYGGFSNVGDFDWNQLRGELPEQVTMEVDQDGGAYTLQVSYTANEKADLWVPDLLREYGILQQKSVQVQGPDEAFSPNMMLASQPIPQNVIVIGVSTVVMVFLVWCCTTLDKKFVFQSFTVARIFNDPLFGVMFARWRLRP